MAGTQRTWRFCGQCNALFFDGYARRWGRLLAAIALLLISLAPSAARVSETVHSASDSITYGVTIPDQSGLPPLVVVWLHGCGADPRAYGSDAFADAKGFAVAYPVAPGGAGPRRETRRRPSPRSPAKSRQPTGLDPARTYIAGHSAGAALAQVLGATHSDLYAAAGFVSGANAPVPAGGRVRAYFVWGTNDRITHYLTGRLQLLQWLKTPTRPHLSVQPGNGTGPLFIAERYRRPCANVEFATGVGMGHVLDFRWPALFPAMTSFLLSQRSGVC